MQLKINAAWKGLGTIKSTEHCRIEKSASGIQVHADVSGIIDGKIYECHYEISLDASWQVTGFNIETFVDRHMKILEMQKTDGGWTQHGEPKPQFDACIDIDISITPMTNTLPINRLGLKVGESKTISVVYIDVLQQNLSTFDQIYTHLSPGKYRYENASNDFNATLEIDANGLVIEYPGLFTRL